MRTADQVAQAWVNGLSSAGDKIKAGVDGVTTAPGQAAARQKAVYLASVQANADKWARNVAAVGIQDWKNAMETKGIPRIASGAAASQAKFQTFMTKLLPYIQSSRGALPARGTFEQNKARASAWMDAMHKFSAK